MKKKKSILPLLLLLLVGGLILFYLYKQHQSSEAPQEHPAGQVENADTSAKDPATLTYQELMPTSEGEIVQHSHYTLSYSEEHEQAEWVYYELDPEMVNGTATRSDKFREDPSVTTGSATLADYKSSGYDRGHLCPAASMSISQTAMDESFYMSNMSPQVPSFNRGGWKKLEEQVRDWARSEKQLFVISGPVLKEGLPTIGANEVSVPEQYYKVIYAPRKGRMAAFLMPNATISNALSTYAVPVDSIESLTGIDFFSALPDSLEEKLESRL